MIKWVRDPDFDGGCCKECHVVASSAGGGVEELGERYRDLCDCCAKKSECRDAGECTCVGSGPGSLDKDVRAGYRLLYVLTTG